MSPKNWSLEIMEKQMKILIPKTAVRSLAFTAILLTFIYLLTPALFSQTNTENPAQPTQTEVKETKEAPANPESSRACSQKESRLS